MFNNDATLLKIKQEVLYQVARLAFKGELEKKKDALPFKMIPGPKAQFRCCIYKEREVIRQRILLAEGKCPGAEESDNIVQVISSACEECPISRYTVTDNCQKCMGKACQQACNFGAISMGRDRSYIDPAKCKECGQCAKACPYNAIADLVRPCRRSCPVDAITMEDTGIVKIDEEKCIQCGQCVISCPFGAIDTKSAIVPVIEAIKSGKNVVAMLAPAVEGQHGEGITMSSWKTAMKKVGFSDFVEVGLGGDMTAAAEAAEWAEAYKEGKKMTTSCCPAFVRMIEKHFPELKENISTSVSPMCALSRLIKAKDPEAVTVFIGPCVAKKAEAQRDDLENNADYVLTLDEIKAIMKAKKVKLEPQEEEDQEASVYGKRFGNAGGVTEAVVECLVESGEDTGINVMKCSGGAECKKALTLLKLGKLPADFIEGMACEGGCVNGPGKNKPVMKAKKDRDALIGQADDRKVIENLKHIDMESVNMHKH
ncbi:MAG: 4Fe-4S dicluster domain-containing protein [Lachnospiraceae bacterium]|nr:4Fe-4S dicluster domain-containing protein [Lachnospiraceae bacterium]